MIIETVKKTENGYLVNGTATVPNIKENRHYQEVQKWVDEGGVIEEAYTIEELNTINQAKLLQEWKINRQDLVESIKITYQDVVYQGDEESQNRMSRAINGLPDDVTTINWVAKDNTVHPLNRVDLKTILGLAGTEQSRVWNENRP